MKNLQEFADELLREGFRVWYRPPKVDYLFVSIDDKLGYVEPRLGVGYAYTTVHVPEMGIGTGFQYANGPLAVDVMKGCCRTNSPHWYYGGRGGVRKWTLPAWEKAHPDLVELKKENVV